MAEVRSLGTLLPMSPCADLMPYQVGLCVRDSRGRRVIVAGVSGLDLKRTLLDLSHIDDLRFSVKYPSGITLVHDSNISELLLIPLGLRSLRAPNGLPALRQFGIVPFQRVSDSACTDFASIPSGRPDPSNPEHAAFWSLLPADYGEAHQAPAAVCLVGGQYSLSVLQVIRWARIWTLQLTRQDRACF